jgi:hypothetical protein
MSSQRGLGAIALILALLVAALLYVGYVQMNSTTPAIKTTVAAVDNTRAFACKTNRQTVEREIQMWLVNHPGETPTFDSLESDGVHMATCPEGGTYALVGMHLTCSKHQ